jgi:ABC-type branched-subunit amino acid transport system substrate-binding protein
MKRRIFLASAPVAAATASLFTSGVISDVRAENKETDDGSLITIGSTAAMTGPLAGFGQTMKLGVDAAIHQINAKGGINSRQLRFEMADDAYVPDRSVENAKKLIANTNIVALLGCLGTANNAAITPLVEAAGIPHLAPLTGASSLRKNDYQSVFHLRASYTDEINRLVQNLVSMGIRDLAMVYLDNPYGKEVAQDTTRALAAANVTASAMVALSVDGKNLKQVIATALAAKPSAVLLGTAGAATTGLVAGLKQASPMIPIAGVSAALTQDGIKALGATAQGIAITHVYPDASQAKHLIVRDYQAAMRSVNQTEFTTGSLEGYISARLMFEAMQRAGRNITRERIRHALASIHNFDMGGFTVNYGSDNAHVGSKFVGLGVLTSDGRLRT